MDLLSYQKGDILFSNCQTLVNRECKLNCVKLQ